MCVCEGERESGIILKALLIREGCGLPPAANAAHHRRMQRERRRVSFRSVRWRERESKVPEMEGGGSDSMRNVLTCSC